MTRFCNRMHSASRFTPRLEQLSDRITPSCTVVDDGGVLTITGDNKANDIQITDDGTTVTVTCDGGTSQDFTDVTKIVVDGGNGGDTVGYDLTLASGGTVAVNRDVRVHLGNGQDIFNGSVNGDLIAGSALSVTAHGENGKDTINMVDNGGVAAGATLDVLMCGGNGQDVIDTSYAGLLMGDMTWKVTGGNGKDDLTANPTFDAGSTGTADVKIVGGRAPNTLTMLLTDNSGGDGNPSTLGTHSFVVDSSHAHDTINTSGDVDVVN